MPLKSPLAREDAIISMAENDTGKIPIVILIHELFIFI